MSNIRLSRKLLSRNQFRTTVLNRHNGYCCVPNCENNATDAHHLLNRNLFTDPDELGGYFFNNGAALCGPHHYDAETTFLPVEELREWSNIIVPVIPNHFDDIIYDTWGNTIVSDGTRIPGELFYLEQCQRALSKVMHLFPLIPHMRQPLVYYLPWSPYTVEKRIQYNLDAFAANMIMTPNIIGDIICIYSDGQYSISSKTKTNLSIHRLLQSSGTQLPTGWWVAGSSHQQTFTVDNIWDRNQCLDWEETKEWCELLGLSITPILYQGPMVTQKKLNNLSMSSTIPSEGYTLRTNQGFSLSKYSTHVVKYVTKQL